MVIRIGTYVIDQCTYRASDNVSAFVTCDKNHIYYTRYYNSSDCQEIIDPNNNTNVRHLTQTIGCNFAQDPPYIPVGFISSIRCPGYNYDDSSDSGMSTDTILIITFSVIGGCCLLVCLLIVLGCYCKRRKLTRSYTELGD